MSSRRLPEPSLTDEERKLVDDAQGLVDRVVRKMLARGGVLQESDLRSLGNAGLIQAARAYDASLGVPFESFAKYRVEGAILDGLRDENRHMRLGRAVRAASRKHLSFRNDPSDVMKDTDDTTRAHLLQFAELHALAMLEGLVSEASCGMAADADLAARESHARAIAALESATSGLNARDRQILDLYYRQNKELKEIAEIVGVSYASIRRYHSGVIARLNAQLRGRGVHEAPSPEGRI